MGRTRLTLHHCLRARCKRCRGAADPRSFPWCSRSRARMKTIEEPARRVPLYGEYEVAVLGGGPAGIAAAAAAAGAGRRTLLIERYGFLGGMGTAAGVTNFCGLFANVHGDIRQVVHGVADDLIGRIDRLGGLNAPHLIFGKT